MKLFFSVWKTKVFSTVCWKNWYVMEQNDSFFKMVRTILNRFFVCFQKIIFSLNKPKLFAHRSLFLNYRSFRLFQKMHMSSHTDFILVLDAKFSLFHQCWFNCTLAVHYSMVSLVTWSLLPHLEILSNKLETNL